MAQDGIQVSARERGISLLDGVFPARAENPNRRPVPLSEGVRHQRVGETTERSAHLEKLKQLFEAAPISRYLGMTLSYCENGVARAKWRVSVFFAKGYVHITNSKQRKHP